MPSESQNKWGRNQARDLTMARQAKEQNITLEQTESSDCTYMTLVVLIANPALQ
jgi:hypothetical protein